MYLTKHLFQCFFFKYYDILSKVQNDDVKTNSMKLYVFELFLKKMYVKLYFR